MALHYENLIVWQKAFLLTKMIYLCVKGFPKEEQYNLSDQMRRAAVSVPSNIAEGSGRGSNNEKNHFFHIAKGSAMELHTQVLLAKDFGYIDSIQQEEISLLIEEIVRMLVTMTK